MWKPWFPVNISLKNQWLQFSQSCWRMTDPQIFGFYRDVPSRDHNSFLGYGAMTRRTAQLCLLVYNLVYRTWYLYPTQVQFFVFSSTNLAIICQLPVPQFLAYTNFVDKITDPLWFPHTHRRFVVSFQAQPSPLLHAAPKLVGDGLFGLEQFLAGPFHSGDVASDTSFAGETMVNFMVFEQRRSLMIHGWKTIERFQLII